MKNFHEFVSENLEHDEEYTIIVDNTIHQITSLLEIDMMDNIKIYPFLYNTMIIVSDIGLLSIMRKKLNIISENLGDSNPQKYSYELNLHAPKVYDIGRTHRIEKFLKTFKHAALNIEYLKNNSIEHQITYDLNISTNDSKENVLKYLRSSLIYLNKSDSVEIN